MDSVWKMLENQYPNLFEAILSGRFQSDNIVAVMKKLATGEGTLTGEQTLLLEFATRNSMKTELKRAQNRDRQRKFRQRKEKGDSPMNEQQPVMEGDKSEDDFLDEVVASQNNTAAKELPKSSHEDNAFEADLAAMEEAERRREFLRPTLDMVLQAARTFSCQIPEDFAREFYDDMKDRGFMYMSHGKPVYITRYTFRNALKSFWQTRQQRNGFKSNIPVGY